MTSILDPVNSNRAIENLTIDPLPAAENSLRNLCWAEIERVKTLAINIFIQYGITVALVITVVCILPMAIHGIYKIFSSLCSGNEPFQEDKKEVSLSKPKQKDSFPLDLKEMIKTYDTKIQTFGEVYQLVKEKKDSLTSMEYSQKLQEAENAIFTIKLIIAIDPSCGDVKELERMNRQLEELFQTIPEGPSLFLRRDMEQLQKFSSKPQNETYISNFPTTMGIKYEEPKVSLFDIMGYFMSFREECGYTGTSVNMKTDSFYDLKEFHGKNFTLVGFSTDKQDSYLSTKNWFASFITTPESIEERKSRLKKIITDRYEEWGYDFFTVYHMSDYKEKMEKEVVKAIENYPWTIMLYHRKR